MADTTTPADTATLSAAPSAIPSAVASAVGTPQSLPPMDPEERTKSINVSLADMVAKATALYQSKKYEEAAEIFSTATESQAELNGEMSPANADVLFLYGRCLFKVGQSNSDVLGGKAPEKRKADKPKAKKPKAETSAAAKPAGESKTGAEQVAEEGVAIVAGTEELKESVTDAKKPLFQFTGDENFEDDDEEEEEEEGAEAEGEEEEDDDLAVAFEILELSRVLFEKQLELAVTENTEGPDKDTTAEKGDSMTRHVKERLSDIHDLLAEISLENEKSVLPPDTTILLVTKIGYRFPEAIKDCRATLKYKKELYSDDSEIIAEAHFKLSLALEFASVTTTSEDGGDNAPKTVDEAMRNEAAEELVKAIESTNLKLKNKEVDLAMMHAPEDNEETRKQIAEVKEIIADMEQRVSLPLPRLLSVTAI
ncbi:hypothetical protein F5Y18DRAFT_14944 [Xylariaceae sp. FL1019]|nr:hypothetical protein F5Y18DRAFT_14944 [Xylariaceae sp. FL1019]